MVELRNELTVADEDTGFLDDYNRVKTIIIQMTKKKRQLCQYGTWFNKKI